MSSKWRESYAGLQNFITANPSIKISVQVVAIFEDVRPEFYRFFDDIRTAFVEEKFPVLLREAEVVSENYTKAEQEVTELLKLDCIFTPVSLQRFLHNPKNELMRGLFDPLFDLLKGKTDFETFEQLASKNIETTFKICHRLGYAKWVALSLVKLLESDQLFSIKPVDSKLDGHGEPLYQEELLPSPKESTDLSFEHGPHQHPPFIMPHFIVHSAKLNKYVSFRSEFQKAEYTALDASENMEWYRIESMKGEYKLAMPNPSLLIYMNDKLEDLVLIADRDRVCRPDMIVEYREPEDWDDEDVPAKTKFYDILNPRLGRHIVSREPVPVNVSQEATPEPAARQLLAGQETKTEERAVIHSLTIGFDQSKLEPIVEIMANSNS